jgi:S-methylmethionine-dependent homocysteine/selenocysteine methylase
MSITILDGSIGQELVRRSNKKPTPLWSTKALLESPELIRQVHDDYFLVGAEIATANSYALHRDRLRPFDLEHEFSALHRKACQIAVEARDAFGSGRVAGAMGPTGWSYRPDLAPVAEQAAEIFGEIARLQEPYVDLLLLETMSSVDQARGALMGANVISKPVWLAVSVEDADGSKLRSGEPVQDILPLIDEFEVEALLINCSIPEAVTQAVPLIRTSDIPVGAYANGFHCINTKFVEAGATVDDLSAREDLGPLAYADFAAQWISSGAQIVGGCCEVGPAHIQELVSRFK